MPSPAPQSDAPPQPMLTPSEVAAELNTSVRTVTRMIKNGDLPAIALPRGYRIQRAAFAEFLIARSTGAAR